VNLRGRAVCLLLGGALFAEGCHDGVGPSQPPPPVTGPFVSAPLPPPLPVTALTASKAGAGTATDVAYVSLAPGTAPGGRLATITNERTGDALSVGVGAGGFDPVPIPAIAGDMLDIAVELTDGNVLHFAQMVPLKRGPNVVRTYPSSGKRDVPLNTTIVVVFSEPIDPATLSTSTIQVRRGSTPVPGTVGFGSADHVTALFTPASPLTPSTVYTIDVSPGIRDLDGTALEAEFAAEFTTAATAGGYEEYFVDAYAPLTADQVGDSVLVHATVRVMDGAGSGIERALIRFRGSIGHVLPDTARTGLDGLATVQWTFHGTMGGGAGSADLSACASNSTGRCDMYWQVLVVGLYSL
jgi:Bacterial Ig-like domain